MDPEIEKKLKALKVVYDMIDEESTKSVIRDLYNNLSKTIQITDKLVVVNESIFLEYKNERIIDNPVFTGNRVKIIVIKDDFIEWFKSKYNKNITSPEYKLFKKFLEKTYGPYPKAGWSQISLLTI